MKIIIDTNVMLDITMKREPFLADSLAVVRACQEELVCGAITSQTVADMFYLLKKYFTPKERRKLLLNYCAILHIADIDEKKVIAALKNEDFTDFEDCLQDECAIAFDADYIVTRNIKHFAKSHICAVTPEYFCKHILQLSE